MTSKLSKFGHTKDTGKSGKFHVSSGITCMIKYVHTENAPGSNI